MNRYRLHSPQTTLVTQTRKSKAFLDKVLNAQRRMPLTPQRRQRLLALLGVGGCHKTIRLSDVYARIEATRILFETIELHLPCLVPLGTPMFHITFVDDIGLTSDRAPNLKLAALKRKVDKAMRAMGISGLVMVEIQPLLNYPAKGRGRTLMLHAHALCWGNVTRRKFRAAVKTLNRSRSWKNHFGAQPVKFRRLKLGIDDALRISCYLAKLPHDGKYRVPVQSGASFRFRPTMKGYPDVLALRIAEGLSHYTIYDAVFGVGDGSVIRKQWKRKLEAWHRERLSQVEKIHKFGVAKFWRKARTGGGGGLYHPYEVS